MLLNGLFNKCVVIAACGLFSMIASAEAEYYTWVDENGVTNYAQKNPKNYDAQHVSKSRPFGYRAYEDTRRPQGDSAKTAKIESPAGDDNPEKEDPTSIDEQRQAIAKEIAAVKKSNCDMGKRNLAQLEAFRRIRVKDENGEERLLNDEEKADRMNEARQIIQENCRG